jgi:hypothetical protein
MAPKKGNKDQRMTPAQRQQRAEAARKPYWPGNSAPWWAKSNMSGAPLEGEALERAFALMNSGMQPGTPEFFAAVAGEGGRADGGRPLPGSMGGVGGGGRAGGGRPGGGGGGGGSGGGGKFQNAAGNLLASLGVPGNFRNLIRRGIVQGWTMDEFANALIRTKAFKKAFPGLVQGGLIHTDFTGGAGMAGASAVLNAVSNYRRGYDDFIAMASAAGYTGTVSKKLYGYSVRQDVSLEEFGKRVQLINTIDSNPGLLDMVNEQRKFDGLKPFANENDLLRAAATNDPGFVDHYQAAWLRNQGFNIDAAAAGRLSKLDSPLDQSLDLSGALGEVRSIRSLIGPELDAEGITDEDLFGMAFGSDPKGKSLQIQQILQKRQTQQQTAANRAASAQASRSPTGGFSFFTEDEPRSY